MTLVGNLAAKIEFPLQAAVTREITLNGSCASRGEYPACLELIARGRMQVEPLVERRRSSGAMVRGGSSGSITAAKDC